MFHAFKDVSLYKTVYDKQSRYLMVVNSMFNKNGKSLEVSFDALPNGQMIWLNHLKSMDKINEYHFCVADDSIYQSVPLPTTNIDVVYDREQGYLKAVFTCANEEYDSNYPIPFYFGYALDNDIDPWSVIEIQVKGSIHN